MTPTTDWRTLYRIPTREELVEYASAILINDFNRRMRHINEHFYQGKAYSIRVYVNTDRKNTFVVGCEASTFEYEDIPRTMSDEAEAAVRTWMQETYADSEEDDIWSYIEDYITLKWLQPFDAVPRLWFSNAPDVAVPKLVEPKER